jgi:hypothetical protein
MACTYSGIDQTVGDCGSDGGISKALAAPCEELNDVTITAGVITQFAMENTGAWAEFIPDDDDSAYYNQEGAREGKKHTFNQDLFLKFEQITAAKIDEVNTIIDCCCSIWVAFLNSGPALVQGIEEDPNGVENFIYAKSKPLILASVLSGTGEEADRVTIQSQGVGRKASLTTSLSATAILAL